LKNAEIANNRIQLTNSIIFMGIYNYKKDKYKEQKEEEVFNNSLKQFKELRNIGNIDFFNEEFKIQIGQSFIGKYYKIMEEINFIFSYFGLVEDNKLKINIKLTIEDIIDRINHWPPGPDPDPVPILPNPFLKDVKDISDDCIYFYNYYKNELTEEKQIVDKLELFFDIIFKKDNQEKVKNLKDKSFLFIIKRMLIICLISFNIDNRSIKNNNSIYLFKEFYIIYEIYKNWNNNDNLNLIKNFKNIYKPFCDRILDKEYIDILYGLKALFESMENEKEKKIKFTNCFLNILEIELEKENIKKSLEQRDNLNFFLDFILNSFPDDFIPLIDLLSNVKLSEQELKVIIKIEKSFNNNILFKLLEKHFNSDKFKEQILYYFESKINYIIFEKEKDSIIKFFQTKEKIDSVIKVINFLEKPEKNNKNNNKFITLFYIAYLKVILQKYINIINFWKIIIIKKTFILNKS